MTSQVISGFHVERLGVMHDVNELGVKDGPTGRISMEDSVGCFRTKQWPASDSEDLSILH